MPCIWKYAINLVCLSKETKSIEWCKCYAWLFLNNFIYDGHDTHAFSAASSWNEWRVKIGKIKSKLDRLIMYFLLFNLTSVPITFLNFVVRIPRAFQCTAARYSFFKLTNMVVLKLLLISKLKQSICGVLLICMGQEKNLVLELKAT